MKLFTFISWLETKNNQLIFVAQSFFTDCVFIIAHGCFVCLYFSALLYPCFFSPFFFFSAVSILVQGVSHNHPVQILLSPPPPCVCVCMDALVSTMFYWYWAKCDSLSQSHIDRKLGLLQGSFPLIEDVRQDMTAAVEGSTKPFMLHVILLPPKVAHKLSYDYI